MPTGTATIENVDHETATIRAFVLPGRQQRFLKFLSSSKTRRRFTSELAHFKALDVRFALKIPPREHDPKSVARLLTQMGAGPKCWVISENSDTDAREMNLEAALRETIGYGMGTFISCIPGRLAYFEDEDDRFILTRKPSAV